MAPQSKVPEPLLSLLPSFFNVEVFGTSWGSGVKCSLEALQNEMLFRKQFGELIIKKYLSIEEYEEIVYHSTLYSNENLYLHLHSKWKILYGYPLLSEKNILEKPKLDDPAEYVFMCIISELKPTWLKEIKDWLSNDDSWSDLFKQQLTSMMENKDLCRYFLAEYSNRKFADEEEAFLLVEKIFASLYQ